MKKRLLKVFIIIISIFIFTENVMAAPKNDVLKYKNTVIGIMKEINAMGNKSIDYNNYAKKQLFTKEYRNTLKKLTALYTKLSKLKAPKSLVGSQNKMKIGCDAYIEIYKIYYDSTEFDENPNLYGAILGSKYFESIKYRLAYLMERTEYVDVAYEEIISAKLD
jgi:hypothetical protein